MNRFLLKAYRAELDALGTLIDELDQAWMTETAENGDPFLIEHLYEEWVSARQRWQHLTSELAVEKALSP